MNCFELLDKYFLIKFAAAERFVLSKYILRLLDVLIVQINLHSNWLLRVHLQISIFERTIQWMFGLASIENKFMAINRFLSEWGVCFIELKIPWKWSVQVKASPKCKISKVVHFICFRFYSEDSKIERTQKVLGAYLLFKLEIKKKFVHSLVPQFVLFLEDKSTTAFHWKEDIIYGLQYAPLLSALRR